MDQTIIPSCGLCCTRIQKIGVKFGNFEVLRDINLHIHCGNLTAIIGPNGSGKSTLLKALLGQVRHTGELKFMDRKGAHSQKPLIGYVPQQLNFDRSAPVSVLDFFSAGISGRPVWMSHPGPIKDKVFRSLEKVEAGNLIYKRLGNLSGGELQKVLLALALTPVPDLLLLDEPVSGIDQKGLELFYITVSELRKIYDLSIVLVSHDLDLVARFADKVVFLNHTIECMGNPGEVYSNPRFIEVFGSIWYQGLLDREDK